MNIVGIIVEYNPFHNGHLHHLNEIKKLYPDSLIVAVMSGNFNQRGEVSIINKWDKTAIALEYGVDIVIELPYVFASQAADIFAKGSIKILDTMGVDTLVFGSESNDIEAIKKMAKVQLTDKEYDARVREYLDMGFNYPTSMSKGLFDITNTKIDSPNDILGICYVKEILKQKSKINPITIQRTNDYNSLELTNTITSASSIRVALKAGKDVKDYVPKATYKCLKKQLYFNEEYFKFLKYKITTDSNLSMYHTVDEGIDYRLKSTIETSVSLNDFINKIKTKRYTYNKISRMLTHILTSFTKKEAAKMTDVEYIRILGFTNQGQNYLNQIKKEVKLPLVTNFSSLKSRMLDVEQRTTNVYASILNEEDKIDMMTSEYKNKPIKRG